MPLVRHARRVGAPRWGIRLALVVSVSALLTGCSKLEELAGPTCEDLVAMSQEERNQAVIEWAKKNDPRVDDVDPVGKSGPALFMDLASLMTYCQQPGHGSHYLDDLQPT